jgi:hypothetical protein
LKVNNRNEKKITILILMVFGYFSSASANELGINLGVSLTAGAFEADSGKEEFKGAHVGGASPGNITKNSVDSPEARVAFASIFVEKEIGMFALGIDYVPQSLDTDTAENTQTSSDSTGSGVNKVKVAFTDLTTAYGSVTFPGTDIYAKVGYVQVDVETKETLATGGAYGNTDLDGYTIALGYNRDMDNATFVRLEAMYMDLDGATLVNTTDATKSITADGISGYGARLSVGKAF